MRSSRSGRIRVLHLGSSTGLYGAERWILALARHLPHERVESWIGAIADGGTLEVPLCRQSVELGIPAKVFESPGKLSLAAIGQLRRFVRAEGIDILHTHGYKTDILGCLAVFGLGCKTVATPHGWCAGGVGGRLRLYEALDRLCFQGIDAVAPLSEALYEELRRIPGLARKMHLIPNGIDLTELDSETAVAEPIASWRTDGGLVIGYIGRLDPGKRVDTLVRAFQALPLAPKHLCIVGDGPERSRLEQLAAGADAPESVTFAGFRPDRLALLRGFDLFVLPSESEGIPRCLMEAMGAGIPVIASDIPGCRALVAHGATGLLFTPGDHQGLAQEMERLLSSPSLRTQLGSAGRTSVRTAFSAERMAERYCELYERVALGREALVRA